MNATKINVEWATKSDAPFAVGMRVMERVGWGESARTEVVKIISVCGDICKTSSNYEYDRHHGGRVPAGEGGRAGYRAIHSIAYTGDR